MNDWEKLLINPDTSLGDAIKVLELGAQRIALVVNEKRQLLGTITDGDVRRALIAQTSMDCPAQDVMCKTSKTAWTDTSKKQVLAIMEEHQLLQLPILDRDERIVGLATLHDLIKKQRRDNPVFLVAGGFGQRLHPLTEDCPKPLLKVGGKPILELILERFIEAGFHRFFISTHFMPERIEQYFGDGSVRGVSIRYIHEQTPLGTAGALGLLPHDEMDMPLFMMNGDLLTTLNFENLLDFHQAHDALATICVRDYEHRIPFGVLNFEGHQVTSIVEKPVHHSFINAGIYLLSPAFATSVARNESIDMPDLIQRHINQGHVINMFPIHEYWLDIGRMVDFEQAQKDSRVLEVVV